LQLRRFLKEKKSPCEIFPDCQQKKSDMNEKSEEGEEETG
jgi:hypothetical protein